MKNIIILFIIIKFISSPVFCQEVRNISAKFDEQSGLIIIYYDLIAYSKTDERYKVRLYYSEDYGKNFNQIFEATNDIGDGVTAGKSKEIRWDYFIENPDFMAKDVIFKVEAKWDKSYEINRLQKLGGAENAFRSLLIPGWGHQKVTGEKRHWLKSAIIYSITAGGLYFTLSSQNTYQQYKEAVDEAQAQRLYDKANNEGKTALILLSTGGGLWLSNVAWVAIRGAKNKKSLRKLTAFQQENPLNWNFNLLTKTTQLTLKIKF